MHRNKYFKNILSDGVSINSLFLFSLTQISDEKKYELKRYDIQIETILNKFSNICGGGENRTPVRIRLMKNIYKLSFLIIVLFNFVSGTKTKLN